ncbi:S1C family serine protease [Herbiconiux ginsengi]|uniref:Serine protease, S1-C subfamily, contains C-terminal PDZ domain n=1 Tax=Herbiconiux ginsengi TaxID=381665 RepID=A0A1H3MDU9_9MICO|nr:trypsin-like peptidase domain-containing protein [Herbiconiux ginsengi]SDY74867.1 serine protease, S1-C subfamily, contains C-terminal PDZ domain [Herbiconiux ginsengi]
MYDPTSVSGPDPIRSADPRPVVRPPRRRRTALLAGAAGLALITGLGVTGAAFAVNQSSSLAASASASATGTGASASPTVVQDWGYSPYAGGQSGTTSQSPYGYYGYYGSGPSQSGGSSGRSGTSSSSATDAVPASVEQTAGVVTIVSDLPYQNARSAGTGIVLTSDGLILTNNHVVEGSTTTEVTDETTGQSYAATVVGTDATHDIALLQLQDAQGLTTASLDTADAAQTGDAVTAVGNAEGTGDLVAAAGSVTATGQSITAQSETGIEGEALTGLIQVDADIVSGDSGGPLLDSDGQVVGIDTAASSGSAAITGFAIPITTALDIAAQIQQGVETDTIEIGYPGFLGIEVGSSQATSPDRSSRTVTGATAGAVVAGVIAGTPAEDAGLAAGDVVTGVNGTAIASGDQLSSLLADMEPGEQVVLTWVDATGATQQAAVHLTEGPAA